MGRTLQTLVTKERFTNRATWYALISGILIILQALGLVEVPEKYLEITNTF